jgi:hypothetical protein
MTMQEQKFGIIPPEIGYDLSVDRGYGTGRFSSINNPVTKAVSHGYVFGKSDCPRAVDKR